MEDPDAALGRGDIERSAGDRSMTSSDRRRSRLRKTEGRLQTEPPLGVFMLGETIERFLVLLN